MPGETDRNARLYTPYEKADGEFRTCAQRDRDRILYSSALRRLAEVTQVVSPDSGYVFHNRLTHSLQVAQVGRRLAERLISRYGAEVAEASVLDPDVVEAACLAHDLGHPPFGHLAEQVLDKAAASAGGFEGNAQSFRIITRLAFRSKDHNGLDLCRATLNAVLKYPWLRGENPEAPNKWGAYETEREYFNFARRKEIGVLSQTPSLEAQLMNIADDITYSVHDMEDFYRAGRIPLHLLSAKDGQERKRFFADVFRRKDSDRNFTGNREQLEKAFTDMVTVRFWLREAYSGIAEHRAALRGFTGQLIDRYIRAVNLEIVGPSVEIQINPELQDEITMFKQLIWTYVIDAPSLSTQQVGQSHIMETLYKEFYDSAVSPRPRLFPAFYRERLDQDGDDDTARARTCIDFLAGLTETQCVSLFRRLTGTMANGSIDALGFI